jgi:hypothetical protein
LTPEQLTEVSATGAAGRGLVREHKRAVAAVRTLRAALRTIMDGGVHGAAATTASRALSETGGIADGEA